jgi:hypothetical protein
LKRKNVGTSYTEFDFTVNPYAVLVKNFTTSDISYDWFKDFDEKE